VRLAAAAERRAGPLRGLALRDGRDLGPRFWRFTYEAETGASFGRDPRTVRLAARLVDTEVAAGSPPLDPFDLVTLGGTEGLDGFEPRRFADLDALTLRLAYVYPLIQHLEMELHAEAGGVWRDAQREARLDRLKGSYGVLLRPRTKFAPLGEVGVTWSAEGVRARFGFGGVE
jgi:outer membrane protein assembly factor BamA